MAAHALGVPHPHTDLEADEVPEALAAIFDPLGRDRDGERLRGQGNNHPLSSSPSSGRTFSHSDGTGVNTVRTARGLAERAAVHGVLEAGRLPSIKRGEDQF